MTDFQTSEEEKDLKEDSTTSAEATNQEDQVGQGNEADQEETNSEDGYREKYYYLAAEFQNTQKRFEKEKEQISKFGTERILKDLLEVVDNFERTLSFIVKDEDPKVKNIVVGIEMINKMFMQTLSQHGLKQIVALGKIFDPNFHEAISQVKDENKDEMEIIEVQQHGYELNGRLMRPAKVIVVKNN